MEDPLPPDPYKALGVPKDAPLAAVRGAYRKLVLTCHPDKVTEESAKKVAADKFHLVQQAYEVLNDETRRQRYDERVRLQELRADVMNQKSGRIIPEMTPRTKTTTFEMRGDRMYEETVPRRSYEEDDYFQPQPRYQEIRPRRQEDRPFVISPRKTSGRASEDKRRAKETAREYEEDRDRRRKEAEKAARSDRNKKRDKDKRRDSEYKSKPKYAYAESETESDSDVTERIHARREEPPRRRYDEELRRPELPRRSTKREDFDSYDDYDTKHIRAQDYIAQSRGSVDRDPNRPPLSSRGYSHVDARPPLTPKVPPMPTIDASGRRGSGRGTSRREHSPPPRFSKKDRRPTEIVDPPRRPKLPDYSSDPKGLRIPITSDRKEPHRSQTLDSVPERKPQPIKRAETMPVDRSRRGENQPLKPSKLKDQHDSGYSSRSSRGTPDLSPSENPQSRSTKYKVYDDSSDSEESVTIVAEPEGGYHRFSETAPKSRRPPMTPHSASKVQMPSMRSGSFAMPPDQPPTPRTAPPFVRTESGRPPPPRARASTRDTQQLYGEVSPSGDLPYRIVNQRQPYRRDDISYSPRKGSEDMDRDAYPGSHHRPGFSRSESRAVPT